MCCVGRSSAGLVVLSQQIASCHTVATVTYDGADVQLAQDDGVSHCCVRAYISTGLDPEEHDYDSVQ